jgi:hypothetical protein
VFADTSAEATITAILAAVTRIRGYLRFSVTCCSINSPLAEFLLRREEECCAMVNAVSAAPPDSAPPRGSEPRQACISLQGP